MTTQLLKYTARLRQADQLIRMEATGAPRFFAQKLGISESYLYGILDEMRVMGLPLSYNKIKTTYVYTRPVRLRIHIDVESLSK